MRGNEFDHEALLASDLWGDLESLRVAAHYAHAWGQLALAAKQVSAEARHQALPPARDGFARLGFEFGHPLLVQRAMYGLAIAHIESGDVAAAKATLTRLLTSLKKAGQPAFAATVKAFPFMLIFTGLITAPQCHWLTQPIRGKTIWRLRPVPAHPRRRWHGAPRPCRNPQGDCPRSAGGDCRRVIATGLCRGCGQRAAGFCLGGDRCQLAGCRRLQPFAPACAVGNCLCARPICQCPRGLEALRPWKALMPKSAQAQLDYYIGASLINLNDPSGALPFLQAARRGYPAGEAGSLLDGLVDLAQLSAQELPDDKLLELAQKYQTLPDLPPDGADLPYLLAMRARVVLAQSGSRQGRLESRGRAAHRFWPVFAGLSPVHRYAYQVVGRSGQGR